MVHPLHDPRTRGGDSTLGRRFESMRKHTSSNKPLGKLAGCLRPLQRATEKTPPKQRGFFVLKKGRFFALYALFLSIRTKTRLKPKKNAYRRNLTACCAILSPRCRMAGGAFLQPMGEQIHEQTFFLKKCKKKLDTTRARYV